MFVYSDFTSIVTKILRGFICSSRLSKVCKKRFVSLCKIGSLLQLSFNLIFFLIQILNLHFDFGSH